MVLAEDQEGVVMFNPYDIYGDYYRQCKKRPRDKEAEERIEKEADRNCMIALWTCAVLIAVMFWGGILLYCSI